MRIQEHNGNLKVWLSANDTETWATRSGAAWPCSFLRGKRVFAEFEPNGDLVDMTIAGRNQRGKNADTEAPADEFNACLSDHIASRCPNHPAVCGIPQPIG